MSTFLIVSGQVKATPTDPHQGALSEELVAGSNIELKPIVSSGDEQLQINSIGTDFVNVAAALGGEAGNHVGYVFKSDGYGSGIMTTNIQKIARRITVSSVGPDADYSS